MTAFLQYFCIDFLYSYLHFILLQDQNVDFQWSHNGYLFSNTYKQHMCTFSDNGIMKYIKHIWLIMTYYQLEMLHWSIYFQAQQPLPSTTRPCSLTSTMTPRKTTTSRVKGDTRTSLPSWRRWGRTLTPRWRGRRPKPTSRTTWTTCPAATPVAPHSHDAVTAQNECHFLIAWKTMTLRPIASFDNQCLFSFSLPLFSMCVGITKRCFSFCLFVSLCLGL